MVDPRVIAYLFPVAKSLRDYIVTDNGSGPTITFWNAASIGQAQPSAQTIATAEASPEFATWLAEHGGDVTLTARRLAKEALDRQASEQEALLRATILVLIDELNSLRQWIESFKTQTAAATNLANFQTRVAGLPSMPDRTGAQARTAIKNKITAGDADV